MWDMYTGLQTKSGCFLRPGVQTASLLLCVCVCVFAHARKSSRAMSIVSSLKHLQPWIALFSSHSASILAFSLITLEMASH